MLPLGDLRWGVMGRRGCPRFVGPGRQPRLRLALPAGTCAARLPSCLSGSGRHLPFYDLAAPFGGVVLAGVVALLVGMPGLRRSFARRGGRPRLRSLDNLRGGSCRGSLRHRLRVADHPPPFSPLNRSAGWLPHAVARAVASEGCYS